jgi:hypothetical protein
VEALFPVHILLLVTTPTGLGAERNLFLAETCRCQALKGDGSLPVTPKEIFDRQIERRANRGLKILTSRHW